MKSIFSYVSQYFRNVDKTVLAIVTAFTALLIWYNYDAELEMTILRSSIPERFFLRFGTFFIAFTFPYLIHVLLQKRAYFNSPWFTVALFIAPLIFTLKMVLPVQFPISDVEEMDTYWNRVLYWPVRLLIVVILVTLFRKTARLYSPGITAPQTSSEMLPYLGLLLLMVPLIMAASTQADFLAAYPKLKMVESAIHTSPEPWFHALLFEISYGSDFFTIEFFFRGFLVVCFIQWVGKDAILPMACFYCTIHFGKPLGECISSYFGGIVLGTIVYNTRNIYGGLMVHLGIAWLMEIGGYLGNYFSK